MADPLWLLWTKRSKGDYGFEILISSMITTSTLGASDRPELMFLRNLLLHARFPLLLIELSRIGLNPFQLGIISLM